MLKKRDYNNAVAADMAVQPAAQKGTVLSTCSSQFIFVLVIELNYISWINHH